MANFIKYKDQIINLELCTAITTYDYDHGECSYLIFFDDGESEGVRSRIATFCFKTEKERDEYFLKIQKRIEKIQGFKIDLGDKND